MEEARYFKANATFWSEDLGCEYAEGMCYTIIPGNTRLVELAAQWAAYGKIEFIESGATIAGSGEPMNEGVSNE